MSAAEMFLAVIYGVWLLTFVSLLVWLGFKGVRAGWSWLEDALGR